MVYAKIYSYSDKTGTSVLGIMSKSTQDDSSWTPYNVIDSTWLYLDSTGTVQIYTQTQINTQLVAILTPQLTVQVQNYIDLVAKKRGYDNAASCISYLASSITSWASDAGAMKSWRDSVWSAAFTNEPNITPTTTWANVLAILPTAPW